MNKSTLYSSIFIIAFGSICFFFFKSTVPTLEKESEKICNLYNDASQSIESLNFTLDSLKASDSIKFSGVELPTTKELQLFDSNFQDEYCSLISVANRLKKIDSSDENKFFINLQKIGYTRIQLKSSAIKKRLIIKAFQRRFRQSLVNGICDKECLILSKNLLKS